MNGMVEASTNADEPMYVKNGLNQQEMYRGLR